MMEYKFDDTIVYICEDTARALVYLPTQENQTEIIDWLDKSNFTCAGVHTTNEDVAQTFSYYFNCPVSNIEKDIKDIETSFT